MKNWIKKKKKDMLPDTFYRYLKTQGLQSNPLNESQSDLDKNNAFATKYLLCFSKYFPVFLSYMVN